MIVLWALFSIDFNVKRYKPSVPFDLSKLSSSPLTSQVNFEDSSCSHWGSKVIVESMRVSHHSKPMRKHSKGYLLASFAVCHRQSIQDSYFLSFICNAINLTLIICRAACQLLIAIDVQASCWRVHNRSLHSVWFLFFIPQGMYDGRWCLLYNYILVVFTRSRVVAWTLQIDCV